MEVINERPEGMSFEDYKALQRKQHEDLKKKKKGEMVFVSSVYMMRLKGMKGRTAKRQIKKPVNPIQEKVNA